jgi:23S rRNA (pseudouridine1915-N3)-methyltransferase
VTYQIRVLWAGRRAQDPLIAAADAYLARLSRFVPAELCRCRGERWPILGDLVLLDPQGAPQTTASMTTWLRRAQAEARPVTFAIGAADGAGATLPGLARATWSLAGVTLPHRLALVVLLEQLYRAHTVLAGTPYAR